MIEKIDAGTAIRLLDAGKAVAVDVRTWHRPAERIRRRSTKQLQKLPRYWKARSHNNKQEKQHKSLPPAGQEKEPGRRQGKILQKNEKTC